MTIVNIPTPLTSQFHYLLSFPHIGNLFLEEVRLFTFCIVGSGAGAESDLANYIVHHLKQLCPNEASMHFGMDTFDWWTGLEMVIDSGDGHMF